MRPEVAITKILVETPQRIEPTRHLADQFPILRSGALNVAQVFNFIRPHGPHAEALTHSFVG
jgi:hypothetical protein